jgi:FtsH-binding integral membrane protein
MSYYRVYRGASDYVGQRSTMQKVFLWMNLRMLVNALVAYITAETSLIDLASSPRRSTLTWLSEHFVPVHRIEEVKNVHT